MKIAQYFVIVVSMLVKHLLTASVTIVLLKAYIMKLSLTRFLTKESQTARFAAKVLKSVLDSILLIYASCNSTM